VGFFPRFRHQAKCAAHDRFHSKENQMKIQIMVAGLVCLSVVAVAQQPSSGQTKTAGKAVTATPSGSGNDKLSGKKGYDYYQAKSSAQYNGAASGNSGQATMVHENPSKPKLSVTADEQTMAVRESPTKASSSLRESPSKASLSVATGDVNGDGQADKTAGQKTAAADVKAPRDHSTGQSTGKRQHQDLTIVKKNCRCTHAGFCPDRRCRAPNPHQINQKCRSEVTPWRGLRLRKQALSDVILRQMGWLGPSTPPPEVLETWLVVLVVLSSLLSSSLLCLVCWGCCLRSASARRPHPAVIRMFATA
jgi:hypothetical protein